MKKEILELKNNAKRIVLATMLIFVTGMLQINAQNTNTSKQAGGSSQIPPEFLSTITFSVNKSASPILSLDATTPYFTEIEIVDGSNNLLKKIIINDIKDTENNIIKREFNFSEVAQGTYYAKGVLIGTMVYYQIFLTD